MTGGVRSDGGGGESVAGLSQSEMSEGIGAGAAIAHRVVLFAFVRVCDGDVVVGVVVEPCVHVVIDPCANTFGVLIDSVYVVAAHSVLWSRF